MAAASVVVPMELTLPATTVQQLVKVPDRYVSYPDTDPDPDSSKVLPYMDAPVIDLQLLLDDSSPLAQQEMLNNLRTVLTSWGCFQLVNHGVASALMDQLHSVGKEFFELAIEEKLKYSRTMDVAEGYGCDVISEDTPINWNDRLQLRIDPVERRKLELWPDIVPDFRETLDKYSTELMRVFRTLQKEIAKSLNIEENIFLNLYDNGSTLGRFNYYPPCPNPDQVVGLRSHSDSTVMTILMQDKAVEGLQVLRDDQWYKVPIIPDALVVNVGDQLEILSNGILKSPIHKAVMTNKDKARMTVVTQSNIDPEKEYGPVNELIDKDRPKLYKNVKSYFTSVLHSRARGERAIENVKIHQLTI